jgi:hypothetical protein
MIMILILLFIVFVLWLLKREHGKTRETLDYLDRRRMRLENPAAWRQLQHEEKEAEKEYLQRGLIALGFVAIFFLIMLIEHLVAVNTAG